MKTKWLKKSSAILLSLTMALSLFPGMKGTIATVQAAENTAPAAGYWTDAAGLKNFGISGSKTIGKIKFGLNGDNSRLWAICGTDTDGTLALLSTSEFARAAYGNSSEYSKSNFVTGMDNYLSATYFSTGEKDKMAEVTVKTNEPNGNGGNTEVSVENKKLYLPNSKNQSSDNETAIYVGSNNDIAIDITKLITDNGFQDNFFWLRSPFNNFSNYVFVAIPDYYVTYYNVSPNFWVVPALNLNLSSAIFASAADAASSIGYVAKTSMTENTYTLRYESAGTETAVISISGTQVKVTDASGKYLMVQNNVGVYAMAIESNSKTVNASDIQMGNSDTDKLENFNNCKVWIESTTDRITTAKMATQATVTTINSVEVTDITAPTAGSALDTEAACATTGVTSTSPTVTWTPDDATAGYNTAYTASVTLTAADDYKFASDVTATINGQNATSVTKNDDGTVTVAYEFPATAKAIVGTPTFSPVAGTYTENQSVALSSSTEGATIYYTTDGTTPTTDSNVYSKAISVTGTVGQSKTTTIKAIAVKSGMQNSSVASAAYVVSTPTSTYTITAAGGTHELNMGGTLTITCDGALNKLTGIYVDDKLVDAANYTLESGSTILTFKAAYLNTLSVGTHKVKFQYRDGSAETTIKIKVASTDDTTTPSEKDEIPKTGDSTPIAWLFIAAVISGAGVIYFGRKKKTVR